MAITSLADETKRNYKKRAVQSLMYSSSALVSHLITHDNRNIRQTDKKIGEITWSGEHRQQKAKSIKP